MDLMERLPITDWTKLSYADKLQKVLNIRSLRESCRREAMLVPTKSAVANKLKAATKGKKPPAKRKSKLPDVAKLLSKLSPAQLKSLKQSYGVE